MEEFLTTKDIASALKVTLLTVRRWITSGQLVAMDLGKEYRIARSDFEKFLEERKTRKEKKV